LEHVSAFLPSNVLFLLPFQSQSVGIHHLSLHNIFKFGLHASNYGGMARVGYVGFPCFATNTHRLTLKKGVRLRFSLTVTHPNSERSVTSNPTSIIFFSFLGGLDPLPLDFSIVIYVLNLAKPAKPESGSLRN
jgi:hypothetical protein